MREFKGWSHEDGRKTKAIPKKFQKTGTFGKSKFRTTFGGFQSPVISYCAGFVVVIFIGAAALRQEVSVVLCDEKKITSRFSRIFKKKKLPQ